MPRILLATLAVVALGAIFHGLGLTKFVPWHIVYSDILGFYERISPPGLPYVDKLIEYPVLTGVYMQIMAWLGVSRAGYFVASALGLTALVGLATYLLWRLAGEGEKKRLWIYWAFAPSMFFFSVFNWDILAVVFTLAAIYFERQNKISLAAGMIALGASAKFFPVLFLVPLLLAPQRDIRTKFRALGAFLLTGLAVNIYFALKNFKGWLYFFELNSTRNSNNDSIWTIVRYFTGEIPIPILNSVTFAIFAVLFFYLMWKYRRESFAKLCFLATISFLLTNKVFSPQYIFWLLPFFVLVYPPRLLWFYGLELANLATFFIWIRWFFVSPSMIYFYLAAPFVILRHLVLGYLLYMVVKTKKLP